MIVFGVRYLEFLTGRGDPYLKYLMSVAEEELAEEFQGNRMKSARMLPGITSFRPKDILGK